MIFVCLIFYYRVAETYMESNNNERTLKISFDSLNKELNNCLQQLKEVSQTLFFPASVKEFENCIINYSKLREDFQAQNFCYDENLCGRYTKEALENTCLRKEAFEEINKCFELLKSCQNVNHRNSISKLIWEFKEQVEKTMPYKIYALSSQNSACPYEVPEKEENEFDAKTTEIKWRFVGFAENIFEAWYYVQQDTYCGVNPCMNRSAVNHVLCEPSDEWFNSFVKIESKFYTEYYDVFAPGPLGQRFGYRKTVHVCFFCGKEFEGYGQSIYPVNYMSDDSCGYNRCCPSCYKKIIVPLKAYDRKKPQQKLEHEKKTEELRGKYNLVMPHFESEE